MNSNIYTLIIPLLFSMTFTKSDYCESVKSADSHTEYNNDTFYLAALINAECGICNETEKILVASTVLNRAKEQSIEIEAAIFSPYQYEGTKTKHFYCTQSHYELSQSILNGDTPTYPNLKYFITHEAYNGSFADNMRKDIVVHGYYHKYF